MFQASQFLAAFCAALFAGAAIYVNVAEHPARMLGDTRAALAQWAPSYRRATWMQASLALISFIAAVAAWLSSENACWLIGAVLIGAVMPFTLFVVAPTNKRLLAADRDPASAETRDLLERWGRLHAVRSALSFAAAALFLWQLVADA